MKQSIRILFISSVVMLVSLACSLGELTFSGKSASLEISLTEEQLNTLVSSAGNTAGDSASSILQHVDKIELHDGYMRVFGSIDDNGSTVAGSLDVSLAANDGLLEAQITAVDIPGKDINDPAIEEANQEIARQLGSLITSSHGDVTIQSVEVQEDALKLKMKVKVINKN